MNRTARATLGAAVERVVAGDLCSGCGACTLLSPALAMGLDEGGFLRPRPSGDATDQLSDTRLGASFARVCPGVSVTAPPRAGRHAHPTLGDYFSCWQGWATDPVVRRAGSSGGVLTALSGWLLDRGAAHRVVGGATAAGGTRSAPLTVRSRAEALDAAGSRYAPVAALTAWAPTPEGADVFVGKPCEVDALSRIAGREPGPDGSPSPLLLSFFCAGTPSQRATDDLVTSLGMSVDDATAVRYRGDGWPGDFRATDAAGTDVRTGYEQSWGAHLGRALQNRCKVCPDGTGSWADVVVADYWDTDARGYPVFAEGDGVSAVIARTLRGHELLLAAREAGVLTLEPLRLGDVAAVQPLQTSRRETLAGRLLGRRLAGRPLVRVRGFRTARLALRSPLRTLRTARASFDRVRAAGPVK